MKYPNTWLRRNSKRPTISFLFLVTFFFKHQWSILRTPETLLIKMRATLILKLLPCPHPPNLFLYFYQRKYIFQFLLMLSPRQLFKTLCSNDYWGSWRETEDSGGCVLQDTLSAMIGRWLWTCKGRQSLALSQTLSDQKSKVKC